MTEPVDAERVHFAPNLGQKTKTACGLAVGPLMEYWTQEDITEVEGRTTCDACLASMPSGPIAWVKRWLRRRKRRRESLL